MFTTKSFFDLEDFPCSDLFTPEEDVWHALNKLKTYMDDSSYPKLEHNYIRDGIPLTEHIVIHRGQALCYNDLDISFGDATKGEIVVKRGPMTLDGASVIMAGAVLSGKRISIGQGVLVESGAMIKSPAIIGDQSEIRQGSYLRGYCLIGRRCVVGHTTEVKHSIFLSDAKAGHFAYLGDSIIGRNSNLGAGTKLANLRFIGGNVTIKHEGQTIDTTRRKIGAILGDECQTGCNSVTSPGTFMGSRAMLLPNTTAASGFHRKGRIIR